MHPFFLMSWFVCSYLSRSIGVFDVPYRKEQKPAELPQHH